MLKITQSFSASEDGINIDKYNENDLVENLPPVALAHGKNIKAYTKLKGEELEAAKVTLAEQALLAENQE